MARALVVLALLLLPSAAGAAGWGNVEPGTSTIEQVRERYGAPSKETRGKIEGYDTLQWIYEDAKAPSGLFRMTVDFGLLAPGGFKASVVRLLQIEPKPFIFGRHTVLQGWGVPDGIGNQQGAVSFFYREGLFVVFDAEGVNAVAMVFTPPQPESFAPSAPPPAAAPPAAAPSPAPPRR